MKENIHNKSKQKVIIVTGIIALLVLITGVTYATWNWNYIGNKNAIETEEVLIEFLESNDVISITNAIPMTDEAGKSQFETFEFQVTTKIGAGRSLKYNLNIEKLSAPAGYTSLNDDQVKIYLTDEKDNPLAGPIKVSELNNYNLYSKININTTSNSKIKDRYKMRIWIDESAENSIDWSIQNNLAYNFKIGISSEEYTPTGAEKLISKVGTGGLEKVTHTGDSTLQPPFNKDTVEYRYTGTKPNNYVTFNGEVWRIIGVFDVDDGKGNIEQRIKLIRNDSIGDMPWASNSINDWSNASSMSLLNTGDYWNRTGDYATTGLTNSAKSMIDDAKWYLGGTTNSNAKTTPSDFYSYERGTKVYSGRPTSWVGKVGLIYPSDYGYATVGGETTSREECLAKEMLHWNDSSVIDCRNNDWLYFGGDFKWTITPNSSNAYDVFPISSTGFINGRNSSNATYKLRPSIYLSADVQIIGDSGTSGSPYILK